MKPNGCVPYWIYHTQIYSKAGTYANELILTPFSLFDIKYKKPNARNHWKYIFRASRRVRFSYFPITLHSIMEGAPIFQFSWIMLQYSVKVPYSI